MNLSDLNKLRDEAASKEAKARHLKGQAAGIAGYRGSARPLTEVLSSLKSYATERAAALSRAEDLLGDELLRIAEMDLEGQARACTAEARAKRAQLAAFLGDDPVPAKAEDPA